MNEIIDRNGCNHYKIPHIGKERLERLGMLPYVVPVTANASIWASDASDEEEE
jgi:hypothetical protein